MIHMVARIYVELLCCCGFVCQVVIRLVVLYQDRQFQPEMNTCVSIHLSSKAVQDIMRIAPRQAVQIASGLL